MVGNSTRMIMQCIVDIRVVQMQASVLRGKNNKRKPRKTPPCVGYKSINVVDELDRDVEERE
jgi:hypothetical protein